MSEAPGDGALLAAVQAALAQVQQSLTQAPDAAARLASAQTALGVVMRRRAMGGTPPAPAHDTSMAALVAREAADAAARVPVASVAAAAALPNFDDLTAAIATHLGGGQAIGSIEYEKLSGGFSRETIGVSCRVDGLDRRLIARREVPGGLLDAVGLGIAQEYRLLAALWGTDVAVAEPLWVEAGGDRAACMMSQRVAGRMLGTSIGREGVNDDHVRALAELLARLHTLPLDGHTDDLVYAFDLAHWPASRRDATRLLLDRWENYIDHKGLLLSPALQAVHQWLCTHLPDSAGAPSLLHGDVGFHNVLFDGADVTALLDWEMAFCGNPAKDLSQIIKAVTAHVPWARFMDWYCAAGGAAVSNDELRYFEIFSEFCNLVVCAVAGEVMLERSTAPDVRYIYLAIPARAYFLANLNALLGAL